MGTPEFAIPSLAALIEAGHEVAAVYTQPDKPKGRGHSTQPTPVKQLALTHDIPVFQPVSLRDENSLGQIVEFLAGNSIDCIVVVAYGKLLPKTLLGAARLGCVNIHSSLLPRYRGAAPINRAILNGDSITGVTAMRLDEGMDTGDILLQAETPIGENETAGELHDRLAEMGAKLLTETLGKLENGGIKPVKQYDTQATRAPMLTKDMSAIDWRRPANEIHNQIRGLQPWPTAETTLRGKRIRVHASRIASAVGCDPHSNVPGTVVSINPFVVQCGGGLLEITQIQADGGKRMSPADYFRGHPVDINEVLGL